MISTQTLRFLTELKAHNNRRWFQAHREDYEAARADFINLVDHLIGGIASFDPPVVENEPEDCVFRIYKDTRFSRNKEPYKTNFGGFITDLGRNVARAGYYVHVEPGECLVAAGLYMPPAPELKAVRRAIAEDPDRLRGILRARAFVRNFGAEMPGPALKTAPRDYPKDHPAIDLLRYTSFAVWKELPDSLVKSARFVPEAVKVLRTSREFVHYLNEALDRRND